VGAGIVVSVLVDRATRAGALSSTDLCARGHDRRARRSPPLLPHEPHDRRTASSL